MNFYDVKTRSHVNINEHELTKKKYVRTTKNGSTQVRYAVRAVYDGRNLTKFVPETVYNDITGPEEN